MEQTFFIIKPDGVRRGLIGSVIRRIEARAFKLERLEMRQLDLAILEKHYADLVDKPFFSALTDYMMSGPVLIGIISGPQVIQSWRSMLGATNPLEAAPGTIRGDFAQAAVGDSIENIAHGSDSPATAEREIALWFEN